VIGASADASSASHQEFPLPKRNYGHEKRQKELSKQRKKEEKRQRKLTRANARSENPQAAENLAPDRSSPSKPD
jgi:hypothetical protein